jgi:tRNA pseudouridine38-40 synthase
MRSSDEPALPSVDGGLVRVRLDIAYEGTDFSGWAVQPGRRTVQGELEAALSRVLRAPIGLTVAGRTDAGVHASGQVAHLDVPQPTWQDIGPSLVRRLNALVAPDVRVRAAAVVPADFDARFGALWRRYEYVITDRDGGADPLRRRHVLSWRRPLDTDAMADAAGRLVGLHDFVAFCRRRDNATTVRAIERFTVVRTGEEIVGTVQADAFCHSMVRSLVGALLAVGDGRRPVEWPATLLTSDRRSDAIGVAPAHGLTLVEVGYPPADRLAERARQTRTTRTHPG